RRPGGAPRRRARARGDVRGRRGRACARDDARDGGRGGGGREARGGAFAGAHASLDALLRLRARARGAGGVPRDCRTARLRRDRSSFGARRPDCRTLVKLGKLIARLNGWLGPAAAASSAEMAGSGGAAPSVDALAVKTIVGEIEQRGQTPSVSDPD